MRLGKTVLIAVILLFACMLPAGAAAHAEPQIQFEILTLDKLTDVSRTPW